MESNGAAANGAASNGRAGAVDLRLEPPPEQVRELAEACVRFVERAIGVKLDYAPETLSILDHYVAQARVAPAAVAPADAQPSRTTPAEAPPRPSAAAMEVAALVANAAGAYFGEVVRRRHPSWWRAEGDDPGAWRIELEPVYLSFSPVELVADALVRGGEPEASERLELEEEDRRAVAERLADLPPVDEETFYAPSTWLEVIDIAIDAIRARRLGEGEEADAVLRPEDYEATHS